MPLQKPPRHSSPAATVEGTHSLSSHVSVVHSLSSLQSSVAKHSTHSAGATPVSHRGSPSSQPDSRPVAWLSTHGTQLSEAPNPLHTPSGHSAPAGSVARMQRPSSQVSDVQSKPSSQSMSTVQPVHSGVAPVSSHSGAV